MRILYILLFLCCLSVTGVFAQQPISKKEQKKQHINQLIRQAEEGALVYNRHTIFGVQVSSLGYGVFYEHGRVKNARKANLFRIDITEINNFYQAKLGYGQQLILGQKGNKNGVSVTGIYGGGLSLGLLRPYYLQVIDPVTNEEKFIKYSAADSSLFLGNTILGGGGLSKGWNEMKFTPGLFGRAALRFDYGRFNEAVSGIELGVTAEYFSKKIAILAGPNDRNFFFQGYIALLFGKRK
jgi:hypothetical protein